MNLLHNRLGRRVVEVLHPRIHPGIPRPFMFAANGCWLCRWEWRTIPRDAIQHMEDSMADQSSITISEPEMDADGKLVKLGVQMSGVAKRQFDELMADPEVAERLRQAIEEISTHPERVQRN